ncbi:hypothetical protein V500_07427, partial [Pseudogymnoascus sp. VKM F-4518 (FW-2643)]
MPAWREASPLQPTTPKPTTSSSSTQLHQTPRPSSSQKRKLNSLDTTTTEPRPSPQYRQARSAQSLSRSQWTFGGERRLTFGEPQRRLTAGSEGAAVEEALSPFSTPAKVRGSMEKDTRSINRSEGYEVVAMPVGGEGLLGFGSEVVDSTTKSKNGGRVSFGSEIVGAVKEQLTPTPKGKIGGKFNIGSEVIDAVKDQLTPTPKSKNTGLRFFGSEVVAAAKEQLTPTPKSKISGLSLENETIAGAKDHTTKSKNGGVDQDWEVVELGSSTDLTIPHRPSIPRKPVIDLEDYEVLSPLTGTTSNTTIPHTIIDDSDSEGEFEFEIISSHTLNPLPRRRSTIYPLRNPPILH